MNLVQFIHIFLLFMLQKEHFGVWGTVGQCSSPLGVEDRSIPDSDMTASSEYHIHFSPRLGRLNSVPSGSGGGAWCGLAILGEWIQVNLRKVAKVTAIATQGRQDYPQWVKSYKICYGQKLDGYCELLDQEFQGNSDQNTPVSHSFTVPIYARFVRIFPLTWHNHNCVRFELYGCKEGFTLVPGPVCSESLGMETRKIPDSDITASTFWGSGTEPHLSRLYLQAASHHGAWLARTQDQNQWLQVKFAQRVEIRRVATQGRPNSNQWVTSYKLNYSSDGLLFYQYRTNKNQAVFVGNSDRYMVVSNALTNPPIVAQYVRVLPVTWHNYSSMRVDFYGCIPDPPVPTAVYPLNGQFGTRDLSSHENPQGVPFNVQLAPGPFGQPNGSYQFFGNSTSYIEFPNNGGLDTRYSMTLLAWVFLENTDGPIFNYGVDFDGVHFWVVGGYLFCVFPTRSGIYLSPLRCGKLNQGAWNFVGASYDYHSGVEKLWIEGKVCEEQNISTVELNTSGGSVRMGVLTGDDRFLKGRISCLQVYNKALTEREVHAVRGLCFERVLLNPVAFFPLNGQYETEDISHRNNLQGNASSVELAQGPDFNTGGSYQFSGNLNSFIYFSNNGGLDTRYSMTFLAWIYHEQTEGPIFYYDGPENGVRFMLTEDGRFRATFRSSNFSYLKTLTSAILEPKTWHFVGASYNYVSGECILWINGSIYLRKVIDWPSELATQQSVVMGAIPGGASKYKGRISCVQLYDRVLTEQEIEDAKQSCFTVGRSNSNQTGYLGETVEMRCDALEGKTVRWRKDGAVLQTKTAGYGTSLRISIVQQSDGGIYICDVINSTGAVKASYNITLRVEDQNFLCSSFRGDNKSDSTWKRWSVLQANHLRAIYEGKWFTADKKATMPSSCVLDESCGVQAPGWLNGQIPSREAGIVHGQVCFNFRKDCCYYSLPVQIKKCSDFFVYKLKDVHPMIPGQYCFTTNTVEFLDQLSNVMYTSSKTNHTLTGHVISSEKSVESSLQCMKHCANLANGQCKSFNHNEVTGECQLNNKTGRDEIDDIKPGEGYNHYYITQADPVMLP